MENIASLLRAGETELDLAGVPDARREAASLLAAALGRDPTFLIAHPEHTPEKHLTELFLEFVTRRSRREPFHYLTGKKEFYGLEFTVTPAVLIPRPETEMLVERSIELLRELDRPVFCEVGVGSACISAAVLVNVPPAKAVGLEISEAAIEIARQNITFHGLDDRLELRRSDVFAGLGPDEKFDLIVSNPPYVPVDDINGLQPEVRDHEPLIALTDGDDGLAVVRRIVAGSASFLKPGGTLMFEIGFSQAGLVLGMFEPDLWDSAETENDLQGIPRIVAARLGVS